MKKLKGQGKLTKLIASKVAMSNRSHFSSMIYDVQQLRQVAERIANNQPIALKLVSFSSSNDCPEQVLSILSFLRYMGRPVSWTVYSDGSHTDREIKIIQTVFPFVEVVRQNIDEAYFDVTTLKTALQPYQQALRDFALTHVMGKKLLMYLNHPVTEPTLFLDSDIVFYKKSPLLKTLLEGNSKGCFLPDTVWGCLHSQYITNNKPEHYQVNVGFFLMNSELTHLCNGLRFLKDIGKNYEYFTEQTVLHIIFNANHYMPLDPRLFIVNTSDQFDFSYAYAPNDVAIRHYTGPVRHKMWQRDWKWQLSLT